MIWVYALFLFLCQQISAEEAHLNQQNGRFFFLRNIDSIPVFDSNLNGNSYTSPIKQAKSDRSQLEISGFKEFSLGVGDGFLLKQSLLIDVNGIFEDSSSLKAHLYDKSVPLELEGNTSTLQELDQAWVQWNKSHFQLRLGDFDVNQHPFIFWRSQNLLRGVDILWDSKKWSFNSYLGQAQTQSERVVLSINDQQRTGFLLFRDGLLKKIKAGSVRVKLDGLRLQDGQDYIFDPVRSSIDLTLRPSIKTSSQLEVEFESEMTGLPAQKWGVWGEYKSENLRFGAFLDQEKQKSIGGGNQEIPLLNAYEQIWVVRDGEFKEPIAQIYTWYKKIDDGIFKVVHLDQFRVGDTLYRLKFEKAKSTLGAYQWVDSLSTNGVRLGWYEYVGTGGEWNLSSGTHEFENNNKTALLLGIGSLQKTFIDVIYYQNLINNNDLDQILSRSHKTDTLIKRERAIQISSQLFRAQNQLLQGHFVGFESGFKMNSARVSLIDLDELWDYPKQNTNHLPLDSHQLYWGDLRYKSQILKTGDVFFETGYLRGESIWESKRLRLGFQFLESDRPVIKLDWNQSESQELRVHRWWLNHFFQHQIQDWGFEWSQDLIQRKINGLQKESSLVAQRILTIPAWTYKNNLNDGQMSIRQELQREYIRLDANDTHWVDSLSKWQLEEKYSVYRRWWEGEWLWRNQWVQNSQEGEKKSQEGSILNQWGRNDKGFVFTVDLLWLSGQQSRKNKRYQLVPEGTGNVIYDSLEQRYIEGVERGNLIFVGWFDDEHQPQIYNQQVKQSLGLDLRPQRWGFENGFLSEIEWKGKLNWSIQDSNQKMIFVPRWKKNKEFLEGEREWKQTFFYKPWSFGLFQFDLGNRWIRTWDLVGHLDEVDVKKVSYENRFTEELIWTNSWEEEERVFDQEFDWIAQTTESEYKIGFWDQFQIRLTNRFRKAYNLWSDFDRPLYWNKPTFILNYFVIKDVNFELSYARPWSGNSKAPFWVYEDLHPGWSHRFEISTTGQYLKKYNWTLSYLLWKDEFESKPFQRLQMQARGQF